MRDIPPEGEQQQSEIGTVRSQYARLTYVLIQALKLAERTIQYADTLTVLTDGYIRAGRVFHAEGNIPEATKCYYKAKDGQPTNVLAAVGLAQMQLKNGEC